MAKYMLFLHDDVSAFANVSPEEMQAVVQNYVAWGTRLREKGVVQGGQKLTDEPGKVMRRRDGHVRVTDGPYSESKELLGGYYLIEAASYEEAVEHARDCPQLEYGGTIEIRQIEEMRG
jgi:hypothetical protein